MESSYGTSYNCQWTKLQVRSFVSLKESETHSESIVLKSRIWWTALNDIWPLKLDYDEVARDTHRFVYHHQIEPPEGNAVAVAAMWYKILMGIPSERSVDLPRVRYLIRREVASILRQKQMGDFTSH